MQRGHGISQQGVVAIRGFDKDLAFVATLRILLNGLQVAHPPGRIGGQITTKGKLLAVGTGGHQGEHQAGRPHQRPHGKSGSMRQRHQRRAGVGHRGAAGFAEQAHTAALAQRLQQIGQFGGLGVFV